MGVGEKLGSRTYTRHNRLQNKSYITRDKKGPSNSTSGYLFKETQDTKLKRHMHPCVHMFIAALLILVKIWKQPKFPSIDE